MERQLAELKGQRGSSQDSAVSVLFKLDKHASSNHTDSIVLLSHLIGLVVGRSVVVTIFEQQGAAVSTKCPSPV